jgi:hypothetical protein
MMKNKFGIDIGNSRLYQKPYKADLILWLIPLVGMCPILLNLVVKIIAQLVST